LRKKHATIAETADAINEEFNEEKLSELAIVQYSVVVLFSHFSCMVI